jgi:RimJ/RimL family protein N-acetyltransferase
MYFIGKGVRSKNETLQQLLNIIEHQNKYGYSSWAVHERETGDFVGRVGLVHMGTIITMQQDSNTEKPVEIGYVISKKHWGKGYTTEVAHACLEWGFRNLHLQEIVAKTNIANIASQRVLQKLGLTFQHHVLIEGRQGMYFSIQKEVFEKTLKSKDSILLP